MNQRTRSESQSLNSLNNHLIPLFLGGFGYISIGILLLFVDVQYHRSSSLWILTLITILHGFIRSICENNMTATLADYFPQKETTAYLIMGTVKTFTCGICFLGFGVTDPRHMNKRLYGIIIIIMGVAAILGCGRAEILTQIEREIEEGNNVNGISSWMKSTNDNERGESNEKTNDEYSIQSIHTTNTNNTNGVFTTDLSSPVGVAVLRGTSLPGDLPISITSPSFGYPAPIPPLPDSLRLISKDSSEAESVVYVAEYF